MSKVREEGRGGEGRERGECEQGEGGGDCRGE